MDIYIPFLILLFSNSIQGYNCIEKNSCSNNGQCFDNICYCKDEWVGNDCSTKINLPSMNPSGMYQVDVCVALTAASSLASFFFGIAFTTIFLLARKKYFSQNTTNSTNNTVHLDQISTNKPSDTWKNVEGPNDWSL